MACTRRFSDFAGEQARRGAVDERGVEIPLEPAPDRQVAGIVTVAAPHDPQHAQVRLPVATRADSQHPATVARLFFLYNVLFMLVARRFLISGRVQGVGFRFFVEGRAAAEGVHGWVRNLADGRVEALLEGDREAVDRVESALWRGPAGASVERVDVEDQAPSGRATGFSIR